jgi:hypothetical protein
MIYIKAQPQRFTDLRLKDGGGIGFGVHRLQQDGVSDGYGGASFKNGRWICLGDGSGQGFGAWPSNISKGTIYLGELITNVRVVPLEAYVEAVIDKTHS